LAGRGGLGVDRLSKLKWPQVEAPISSIPTTYPELSEGVVAAVPIVRLSIVVSKRRLASPSDWDV
jgi:hypothetical protein